MRLLFIYFYKEFATFQKGSIIHLSKKYKFILDKENSTETKFYFNKENNPNYIEDFYSKNIDIGVLIGENGTGKSVLINTLLDSDNNNHSIIVYEVEDNIYYIGKLKQIIINELKVNKENYFKSIYYSSIIDVLEHNINSLFNISNRNLLTQYDKLLPTNRLSLNNKLSLIENDDIHKYFNLSEKFDLDTYPKIKEVKIYSSKTYFQEVEDLLIKNYKDEIIKILIDKISSSEKNINNFINEILNDEYIKIVKDFENDEETVFLVLSKNISLVNKLLRYYQQNLKKNNKIRNKKFESNSLNIENFYQNIITLFEKKYTDNEIAYRFSKHMYYFLDQTGNHKDGLYVETFLKWLKQKFDTFNIEHEIKDIILDISIILFYQKYFDEKIYSFKSLDYRNIFITLIKQNKKNLIDIVNRNRYEDKIIEKYLFTFINDIRRKSKTLDLVRFSFIYSFKNYYDKDKKNSIIYERDIGVLQSILNQIYALNDNISIFKSFNYEEDLERVDIVNKLANHFKLKNEKTMKLLKSIEMYPEGNNFILKIGETFFEYYKLLIKNSIKPFTYEVYPPLSSGQKAILFIFARINDAIQKIKEEKEDESIVILLDEADLKLHLEWQRQFLYDLIEFLNSYSDNKFYILYATHSPMILSDITNDRVVFLKKEENSEFSEDKQDFTKSTFGANIYDIYGDSFFVDDFMGKFAQDKITHIIEQIESHKIDKQTITVEESKKLLKVVKNIGEPLLRNKLEDDLKSLFEIKNDIEEIVQTLRSRNFEEIKKELDKYTQDKQKEILEKLFGNQYD